MNARGRRRGRRAPRCRRRRPSRPRPRLCRSPRCRPVTGHETSQGRSTAVTLPGMTGTARSVLRGRTSKPHKRAGTAGASTLVVIAKMLPCRRRTHASSRGVLPRTHHGCRQHNSLDGEDVHACKPKLRDGNDGESCREVLPGAGQRGQRTPDTSAGPRQAKRCLKP